MTRALALWLPVLAALALYAPTLRYDRTFDDVQQTVAPGVVETRTLGDVWSSPYWQTAERGGLYRPVLSMTFWLEGKAGLPLPARHAANVLLHALVTLMLVRLLLGLGLEPIPAGLGGLLFAVHPVHVEAVAGLVGRAELLAALLMLAALALHDRARSRERGAPFPRIAVFAGSATLAFLSAGVKESAWALPFYAAALDLARGRRLRSGWPAWAGYVLGIGLHLALRRQVLGGWLNAPGSVVTPFDNPLVALHGVERLAGGLRVAGLNLVHMVFPVTLAPDFSGPAVAVTGSFLDPRLWGGVLVVGGALAVALWGGRNLSLPGRSAAFVGAVWVLASVFLVMNLVFTIGTVLADRVLYWPSAGWCFVLAATAAFLLDPARDRGAKALRLAARDPRRPFRAPRAGTVFAIAVAALAVVYTVRAAAYLPAWRDDVALFEASVRAEPRAPRAWYNLGRSYQDVAEPGKAIEAFARAVELAPDYQEAWSQLATAYMQESRWEDARAPLAVSLKLNPGDTVSLMNEGVLWLRTGREAEAAARFREIAEREPARADAWHNLALALERSGDSARAASAWRRLIELRPDDATALNNLAWLLATRLGDSVEGERLARRAVAIEPANPDRLDTLAETLFRQGKRDEAVAVEAEALRMADRPDFQEQLRRFREDPIPAP